LNQWKRRKIISGGIDDDGLAEEDLIEK